MSGQTSKTTNTTEDRVNATIAHLLDTALERGSNTIHLEPRPHVTVIRFRTDGILSDGAKVSREHHDLLVERLKSLADSADNTFTHQTSSHQARVHITSLPVLDGEKIVLHVVPHVKQADSLTSLGFWGPSLQMLEHALSEPRGVILSASLNHQVANRTLYGIAGVVQSVQRSIIAIDSEMPQTIDGINHMPHDHRQLALERLHGALQQDSDVIVVGNLLERSVAELSFEAGMTNRLLLTNVYAANSSHALRRILDMSIAPHVVAASLRAITAQKLVPQLCVQCREAYIPSPATIKRLAKSAGLSQDDFVSRVHNLENQAIQAGLGADITDASSHASGIARAWRASKLGCQACYFSGYRGQIAACEVLPMSSAMQRAVILNLPTTHLQTTAQATDFVSLELDHAVKALRGLVQLETNAKRR